MELTDLIQEIKKAVPANRFFADHWPDNWATLKGKLCLCPFHEDKETLSLQIDEKFAYCHGCGTKKDVIDLCQDFYWLSTPKEACDKLIEEYHLEHLIEKAIPFKDRIEKIYDYPDENRVVLSQKVRLKDPKNFLQRPPNPKPGKKWGSIKGIRVVLWRLPELMENLQQPIWLVEGEKDVENLMALGFLATTSPTKGGWAKYVAEWAFHEVLRDRDIIICPDYDKIDKKLGYRVGWRYAEDVAKTLIGFSESVKLVLLPDISEGQDVSDFIELHGADKAKKLLLELADNAPALTEPPKLTEKPSTDTPTTLRSVINETIATFKANEIPVDYAEVANAAFKWFQSQGARFFRTIQGEPFMSFRKRTYWLNSGDRNKKEESDGLLFNEAGLMQTSLLGRNVSEGLRHLVLINSKCVQQMSWSHADIYGYQAWSNLNNPLHQIIRISPGRVSIELNGDNPDDILLATSNKMLPIEYIPGVNEKRAANAIEDHFLGVLPCEPIDRHFIFLWLVCVFVLLFVGTRPILRIEGDHDSGKTWLLKILCTLIYGQPLHKKTTVAAIYADATVNPLECLDNLEIAEAKHEIKEFLLISATGGSKEKRASGSDSATIMETPRCLVATNGIEPVGASHSEIISRTFTVQCSQNWKREEGFIESAAIAHLQKERDLILSWVFDTTAKMLKLMREGCLGRAKALFDSTMKGHSKKRCNDYLGLMYLFAIAGGTAEQIEEKLTCLDDQFQKWILRQDARGLQTGAQGNEIVTALSALFQTWHRARLVDHSKEEFINRYLLNMTTEGIHEESARNIFAALRTVAKDRNLPFSIGSPVQLGVRLSSDGTAIAEAGLKVLTTKGRSNVQRYTISRSFEND